MVAMKHIARHFQWLLTSSFSGFAEIAAAPTILQMILLHEIGTMGMDSGLTERSECKELYQEIEPGRSSTTAYTLRSTCRSMC
jgi:hypothetical protein